jgi:hypothetical protein
MRSVMRIWLLCGMFWLGHDRLLDPTVSITSVSPSQRPTEWP